MKQNCVDTASYTMTLKDFLSRNYILLANIACFVGFCVQFANVLHTYVHPTQTNIEVTERDLYDSDFPLLFKVCFNSMLNLHIEFLRKHHNCKTR